MTLYMLLYIGLKGHAIYECQVYSFGCYGGICTILFCLDQCL